MTVTETTKTRESVKYLVVGGDAIYNELPPKAHGKRKPSELRQLIIDMAMEQTGQYHLVAIYEKASQASSAATQMRKSFDLHHEFASRNVPGTDNYGLYFKWHDELLPEPKKRAPRKAKAEAATETPVKQRAGK